MNITEVSKHLIKLDGKEAVYSKNKIFNKTKKKTQKPTNALKVLVEGRKNFRVYRRIQKTLRVQ